MIFSAHRLYAVSNRRAFPEIPLETYLRRLIEGPAEIIQWREKDLAREDALPWIRLGNRLAQGLGKFFLVNGDLEVALAEGCSGVHLTSRQSPLALVPEARRAAGPGFLVGQSVHSLDEALQAEAAGVDYVMLGPVFAPLSKTSSLPTLGLDSLRLACRTLKVPVAAIGGIQGEKIQQVFHAGAWAAAGITWAQ